jgi:phage gpG-like protein
MITASIIGGRELVNRLDGTMPQSIREQLLKTVEGLAIKLSRHVKEDKLSGQVLKVQTGRLRRSINYKLTDNGKSVVAIVGTNVEYARVHEYGGTFSRASKVGASRAIYPERSFLRSSLQDMDSEIKTTIVRDVRLAMARAK